MSSDGASPGASRPRAIQHSRVQSSEEIVRSFVESMSSYARGASFQGLRGHPTPGGRHSFEQSVELSRTPHSIEGDASDADNHLPVLGRSSVSVSGALAAESHWGHAADMLLPSHHSEARGVAAPLLSSEAAKESIEQPPDADTDGAATTSSPTLRPPPVAADGEEADVAAPTRRRKLSKAQETTDALAIGVINTIVTLPVTLAYVSIMFPSHRFRPYISSLSKLVFFGSALHQLTFSLSSSLPFAIGQVQDVGLIFLSAMSTKVVESLDAKGEARDSVLLTTTLLAMTISTFIVGALLIFVGKRKLASYIAYIPMPVVAGYLGYVGYFCMAAGAAQASGYPVASIMSWLHIFSGGAFWKTCAGLASFAFIYVTLRFWEHPLSMPTVLCAVPVLYYAVLSVVALTQGLDWADLTHKLADTGWITYPKDAGGTQFWQVYELYDLFPWRQEAVAWGVLLRMLPITFALFFVVTFGSCLDITAIQANLSYEVDYNAELVTVGISNMLTGILGAGFTGSYIFSQTTFTQRSGCENRLVGYVVVAAELLLFLVPMSFVQYLPNFYYGALMLVFGLEIGLDWLVFSFAKFTRGEYALTLTVFAIIMAAVEKFEVTGLEIGIAVGVLVCAVHFTVEYGKVQVRTLTTAGSASACVRPLQQRAVLALFRKHLQAVNLSGYVFFGSAVVLGDRIRDIAAGLRSATPEGTDAQSAAPKAGGDDGAAEQPNFPPGAAEAAQRAAMRFVLLNFDNITGLDATAAATFKKMAMACSNLGVVLGITGVAKSTRTYRLLVGNDVVTRAGDWQEAGCCPCFASTDDALAWCEEHFLAAAAAHGLMPEAGATLTLVEFLRMHTGSWVGGGGALERAAEVLRKSMRHRHVATGERLFSVGEESRCMFIVLSGEVACEVDFAALTASPLDDGTRIGGGNRASRLLRYAAGGVVGDLEFMLRKPRSFGGLCTRAGEVFELAADEYVRLMAEQPQVAVLLQHAVLHNEMHSTSCELQAMRRGA